MSEQIPPHSREIFTLISELMRTLRCCQQESVFCENVTLSQFFILDAVGEKKELRLSELHEILSVDKSTTTRLVNPLVKQGLVRRDKSNHDSRAVNLRLTRKGKAVREKVWVCLAGFLDGIQKGISKENGPGVLESVRLFLGAVQSACATGQCRT